MFSIQGKDDQQDRQINIVNYFQEFHGLQVLRPRLPCIQVRLPCGT